ncbi:MAG: DUF1003 domain-containing protein [Parvibaculum sp.]|uniref:DUF1003 domain-containing protein n=1 Tax=Parvibaculum sp. TaxID=2024848 RepID=UPI00283B05A8|nr:DUF1003 domain-containing protein [Parvibaculum sp.]MDR3498777.1 DUF1003 domain-containing protein [Parvibaculum sp.]
MKDAVPSLLTSHDIAKATEQLRTEHRQETGGVQQIVDRITAFVGHPGFLVGLTLTIILWMAANLVAGFAGFRPMDPPPFALLQGALSAMGLYVAALILSTQRREDQLSSHREQLNLELAILNDQKASKIIQLLEEGRRDNPMISDRVDDQALAMSTPSDPHSVLIAIKEVQDEGR